MKTNYKLYSNFLFNLIIAGIVIYTYATKLIEIMAGKNFPTITGLDNFIIELISFVISIICIATVNITISALKDGEKKEIIITRLIALVVVSLGILSLIIFSAGQINFVFALGPMILASTFIKLRQINVKEPNAGLNLLGYVWIYILCFMIPIIIDIYTNNSSYILGSTFNMDQSNIYVDTFSALIYYVIIGVGIPIINILKRTRPIDVTV